MEANPISGLKACPYMLNLDLGGITSLRCWKYYEIRCAKPNNVICPIIAQEEQEWKAKIWKASQEPWEILAYIYDFLPNRIRRKFIRYIAEWRGIQPETIRRKFKNILKIHFCS